MQIQRNTIFNVFFDYEFEQIVLRCQCLDTGLEYKHALSFVF